MLVTDAQMQPINQDEVRNRKKALRDAVFLVTGMRFASIVCYLSLYFIIELSNKPATMSSILQVMTLVIIPLQGVHVYFLLSGVLKQNLQDVEKALWLCLILAVYNIVLGILGGIYFTHTGYYITHFYMVIIFACLAVSLITVFFHDVLIIYAYKKTLQNPEAQRTEAIETSTMTS